MSTNSTVVNAQKVNEALERLSGVKTRNDQIFASLDKLMVTHLPNVWKGNAASSYVSRYQMYKKGLIKSFDALLVIYQETLGSAADNMLIDDNNLATKLSDSLGVDSK